MNNPISLVPPPAEDAYGLLNSREVAALLGVDISWVKNHCTRVSPYLPHIRLGSGCYATRRVRLEHIEKFLDDNTHTRGL